MARIEIRGVIVPSNYDLDWTRQYVEKGIISPESYVRKQIAGADKDKPMEVYINSPGGSVFAAYEIINALSSWRMENNQPVNITVGAMAASAASAIAVLSGAKINVHRNSKLMFHGAWTETMGGSEAHEDTAKLLEQINADIKTQLVSRYGIAAEVVDEWFAEGRQGWINAQDAVRLGMAEAIVDADDQEVEFADADVAGIEANGLAIAAMLQREPKAQAESETAQENGNDEGGQSGEQAEQGGDEKPADDKPADAAAPADDEKQGKTDKPANIAAEVERLVELRLSERVADHMAALKKANDEISALKKQVSCEQSAKDKAIAALAKAQKDFDAKLAETNEALKQVNARYTKLTLGSLTFSPDITSWPEALAACGGDYAKAAQKYPDLARNYRINK